MYKSTPQAVFSAKRIRKKPPAIVPIGAWLNDEREECFCLLIADGLPLAIAFKTAGYTAKDKTNSALKLFKAPRIQERVTAILKARASHPAVSLSEVTDMLKRVYVGALHSNEFTPAHNAAFSLARLYGLVVDRAQLDVIRRPSREPDAPSEVSMGAWIEALPPYTAPASPALGPASGALPAYTPAQPQGPSPSGQGPGLLIEGSLSGCDLDAARPSEGPGQIENGAPTVAVTEAPNPRAHSSEWGPPIENGAPSEESEVPGTIPAIEDLF